MSFWNPEPTYPPDATYTVTIKATDRQRDRWERAAERYGIKSRGAFIAWAADFAALILDAKERADEDRRFGMRLWNPHTEK
jgi:hypothetical protein